MTTTVMNSSFVECRFVERKALRHRQQSTRKRLFSRSRSFKVSCAAFGDATSKHAILQFANKCEANSTFDPPSSHTGITSRSSAHDSARSTRLASDSQNNAMRSAMSCAVSFGTGTSHSACSPLRTRSRTPNRSRSGLAFFERRARSDAPAWCRSCQNKSAARALAENAAFMLSLGSHRGLKLWQNVELCSAWRRLLQFSL